MTDRRIMTADEARALPWPEGWRVEFGLHINGEWGAICSTNRPAWSVAHICCAVANGYLPRAVLDHAVAASKGEEWPAPSADAWTPERKEAAVRLVVCVRQNDKDPSQERLRLCDIIDPQPLLPEIAQCPYCGGNCAVGRGSRGVRIECIDRSTSERCDCTYSGPRASTDRAAIEGHNRVAKALEAAK
jgi:hypothetical protein